MKRLLVALVLVAGCHPEDIDPLERQPKYKPYSENTFFSDGRAMRTPPEGTVAREHDFGDPPAHLDRALLELGHRKYEATCAACHGITGDGDSVVTTKMSLRQPPTLLDERLRTMPSQQIYDIVSEGYGVMPRYATALDPRERWAVVAYVRALQTAAALPLADAPADVKREMEKIK
jgi:mono/diheme cytochrome c family protein